ncbi:P-loop containing nucleoside triphosphate hydrolase protein [Thelephora terrestris]|uniref:P-loop containing nucleoside triphosphate hydrolase protein n=1 Tax=Thelephora terrestris TaxID=56493 RepID=A0A9P6LCM2_9AGAM|nr:P-loop containing nucleoside triphosphate hydrolase protein [Thelephora terrestris]
MSWPPSLNEAQKQALKQGRVNGVLDLFATSAPELSKRCRLPPFEIKAITELVCQSLTPETRTLEEWITHHGDAQGLLTTGDATLDRMLGGGIRTGMIWEFVGESAAGKTQLAMQLSLVVQLPPELGGLSGSTCYLTTETELETRRLDELSRIHPLLATPSARCTLDDINTIKTPTVDLLANVLRTSLPQFVAASSAPGRRPVKLLVIDCIADFFLALEKTTTATLVERARNLNELSSLLHSLASRHQIAVVVINRTQDIFDWSSSDGVSDGGDTPGQLIYREQSHWFGSADSMHEERGKEAKLGLGWANQINVRLMFTRTTRERRIEDIRSAEERSSKRRRVSLDHYTNIRSSSSPSNSGSSAILTDKILVRRMTVVFSSVSPQCSVDFVVTREGVFGLEDSLTTGLSDPSPQRTPPENVAVPRVEPLDVGLAASQEVGGGELQDDEDVDWDALFAEDQKALDSLDLAYYDGEFLSTFPVPSGS